MGDVAGERAAEGAAVAVDDDARLDGADRTFARATKDLSLRRREGGVSSRHRERVAELDLVPVQLQL